MIKIKNRLLSCALSKEKIKIDLWLKEIAPSNELRKCFSHDPKKWQDFQKRYKEELKKKSELLQKIKKIEKEKRIITFLYSAKDEKHNNAIVLRNIISWDFS